MGAYLCVDIPFCVAHLGGEFLMALGMLGRLLLPVVARLCNAVDGPTDGHLSVSAMLIMSDGFFLQLLWRVVFILRYGPLCYAPSPDTQ